MPFLEIWCDYRVDPPVRMILDADDRLKIKQGKITLAVYHEEKEKWYGFIDGKLVQVDWFNIKSLATAFGVKY